MIVFQVPVLKIKRPGAAHESCADSDPLFHKLPKLPTCDSAKNVIQISALVEAYDIAEGHISHHGREQAIDASSRP